MYRIDNTSAAIKELQRLLRINQTTIYDQATRNAVLRIQNEQGLDQTGVADYQTFTAIVEKYHDYNSQIWNSDYLFNPKFPYILGDMDDNIGRINDVLSIVLKDYSYEGLLPKGTYYGDDTQNAAEYLRKIFKMQYFDGIDAKFMNRLLIEKNAIDIKDTKSK